MEGISEIKYTPLINGLIISAGMSARMGKFKPLMDFEGLPFIVQIIKKINPVCSTVNIVTGHLSEQLKSTTLKTLEQVDSQWLGKINWIYNPEYKKGMFTSLQRGVKELGNSDWLLYHFVDQPAIPAEFYINFVREIDDQYGWIQPQYKGRHGHPLLLAKNFLEQIATAGESENLKKLSWRENIRKKFFTCSYPQVLQDFDTPEDIVNLKP